MKNAIEIVSVKNTKKVWLRLKTRNGEIILDSELYSSVSAAKRAANRIYRDLNKSEWEIRSKVLVG